MAACLEVVLAPGEFEALRSRDKRETVCVVFDVLRATSSILTALSNGAKAIIPVEDIAEALAWRERDGEVLLAGERQGLRIGSELAGGIEFDFGNSPREFVPERVRGRTLVTTTTNGTRALRACAGAQSILVSALLNLRATSQWVRARRPKSLLLVCSGTHEEAALEDIFAAGALTESLGGLYQGETLTDSAQVARDVYAANQATPLEELLGRTRNGRRLLSIPELRGDVQACAQRDIFPTVVMMDEEGRVCVRP